MDKVDPDELKIQSAFCNKVEEIIKSFQFYRPNIALLEEVMSGPRDFKIFDFFGCAIYLELANYFQAGVTQKKEEHRRKFMTFAKTVYLMLKEKHKLKFHKVFVDLWAKVPYDYCQFFESICEGFNKDLEQCFQVLVENKRQEKVDDAVIQKLRWACIISPVATFVKLFVQAANHPHIMPTIIKLCRLVPFLFNETEHHLWHSPFEVNVPKEKMANVIFRRLIFEGRGHFTTAEQWENVDCIGLGLTFSPREGVEPIMRPEDLLNVALCELCSLTRVPAKSIEVLTVISGRLLDINNPHKLDIKFATSRREQPKEGLFLTPTIVDMALKLAEEFSGVSKSIEESAYHILRSIGYRMSRENVIFDEETREHTINVDLVRLPWCIQMAMFSWFFKPLGINNLQVPAEIYRAIKRCKPMFVEIENDADKVIENPGEAYFVTLFELALVDAHAALELFSYGCNIEFEDIDLVAMFDRILSDGEFRKVPLDSDERSMFAMLLDQILRNTPHKGGNNIEIEVIDELMRGPVRRDFRPIAPAEKIYPTESIKALDDLAPLKWPEGAFKMPNVNLRAIHKQYKEQHEELLRKVRENHEKSLAGISEKWKGEGVVDDSHCHKTRKLHREKELGMGEKMDLDSVERAMNSVETSSLRNGMCSPVDSIENIWSKRI